MSLKGQIHLEHLEFRCNSKSRPRANTQGESGLSFQRNICNIICISAWDITLVRERQLQHSEPLLCQAEEFSSSVGKTVHCRQWAESKTGGRWLGTVRGHSPLWGALANQGHVRPIIPVETKTPLTSAFRNPRRKPLFPSRSSLEDHFNRNLWG